MKGDGRKGHTYLRKWGNWERLRSVNYSQFPTRYFLVQKRLSIEKSNPIDSHGMTCMQ